MDQKLFQEGQKCLLLVEANAPAPVENELGGSVLRDRLVFLDMSYTCNDVWAIMILMQQLRN